MEQGQDAAYRCGGILLFAEAERRHVYPGRRTEADATPQVGRTGRDAPSQAQRSRDAEIRRRVDGGCTNFCGAGP